MRPRRLLRRLLEPVQYPGVDQGVQLIQQGLVGKRPAGQEAAVRSAARQVAFGTEQADDAFAHRGVFRKQAFRFVVCVEHLGAKFFEDAAYGGFAASDAARYAKSFHGSGMVTSARKRSWKCLE